MNDTKKYKFTLHTLSTMILSPREQCCFYENNIVYPFYQYGMYEKHDPENAQYYIPGSSIKGTVGSSLISFDDIRVENEKIHSGNIYKLQNIHGEAAEEKPKLKVFFPKVFVEMLDAGTELEGELFTGENPASAFDSVQQRNIKKLRQLLKQTDSVLMKYNEGSDEPEDKKTVCEMKSNLQRLLHQISKNDQNRWLVILGGYKGLNLSGVFEKEANGAIYIDTENNLPHGLAWIRLE